LQIEHLVSCRAVSAAARRCRTGNQTIDCGSSFNQSRKVPRLIFSVVLANSKQLRTEGSTLEPPKAATSPSCFGI